MRCPTPCCTILNPYDDPKRCKSSVLPIGTTAQAHQFWQDPAAQDSLNFSVLFCRFLSCKYGGKPKIVQLDVLFKGHRLSPQDRQQIHLTFLILKSSSDYDSDCVPSHAFVIQIVDLYLRLCTTQPHTPAGQLARSSKNTRINKEQQSNLTVITNCLVA